MNVGFFTAFRRDPQHYALAAILVRSIREVMPGVRIVHMTDERSPAALGVDDVWRRPDGPLLERRLEFYARCSGDWLLLDTDTYVQRDVQHVFTHEPSFDVAFADREWSLVKDHYKYSREMPFNTGVVFSRDPAFYARAAAIWRDYPPNKRGHWWSEQWAVADAAHEAKHNIRVLPGMLYNRPPAFKNEDISQAFIVHYKGPDRKAWMIERGRQAADALKVS